MAEKEQAKKPFRILLLTNRDSDNTGDQVIEQSDIALLKVAMVNILGEFVPPPPPKPGMKKRVKNAVKQMLGKEIPQPPVPKDRRFVISSRSASIVTQKYIEGRRPEDLEMAEKVISEADVVILGGAPMFNYLYQTFYERTAITIELAKKYGKPMIFSAIGVESYSEKSQKCQRLKQALNEDVVLQITTRDDFDYLQQYKENPNLVIGQVSDPAVYSAAVFEDFIKEKTVQKKKKKIGLFILRANGFLDNKIDFDKEQAAQFWLSMMKKLDEEGLNYEVVTSGHFGDEAFVDYLVRNYGVPLNKCIFNINAPEDLFAAMSRYDGIISCRLHPSIISYSMGIPSVGLRWNNKVRKFYEGIGYPERVIDATELTADRVWEAISRAMEEGIEKDTEFLGRVYATLFQGLGRVIQGDDFDGVPFTYEEVWERIPRYAGTSDKEKKEKLKRKFRRAYQTANERLDKVAELKEEIEQLKEENKELKKERTKEE